MQLSNDIMCTGVSLLVQHAAFIPLYVGCFSDREMETEETKVNGGEEGERGGERMFTLKKWNAVAMWSWDVECDTCAICRVQVGFLQFKAFWSENSVFRLWTPA